MLKTPMRKVEKNPKLIIQYILIFLYVQLLFYLFIYESKKNFINNTHVEFSTYTITLFISESVVTVITFLFSYLKDPGYIKPEVDFLKLLEVYEDLG